MAQYRNYHSHLITYWPNQFTGKEAFLSLKEKSYFIHLKMLCVLKYFTAITMRLELMF